MASDVAALKKRREAARPNYDAHKPMLDDALDYVLIHRRSTRDTGKGEERQNRVYDLTAPMAIMRGAGRLHQDLVPPGFYKLEPGPVLALALKGDPNREQALRLQLENVTSITATLFETGEWDTAFHEMALDLMAGTGAMLILPGDDEKPVRFCAVAIDEVILEGGPYGDVTGIFWTRTWTVRSLREAYPKGKFGLKFKELEKTSPEKPMDCHVYTIWEPKKRRWVMAVQADCDDNVVAEAESRTCPWITPRYYRVPGEVYGRGPITQALPAIRTVNTAQRLALQAAAIVLSGIYTAVDDGVFNPAQAPVAPGAFWKVARNGGVMGPTIQRLQDPRIDLSQIIVKELQVTIQGALLDATLPPDGAAVRSATEILERVKRMSSDYTGAFGRLVSEIVVPVVRRVTEIAYSRQLIPDNISIDQLLVRVRVVSPLAQARQVREVEAITQGLQLLAAIDPRLMLRLVQIDPAMIDVLRALGFPERNLTTAEQRAEQDQQDAQAAQMAQMMAAAPAAKDAAQAVSTAAQIGV